MYTKYKFNELTLTATNYNNKVSVELPSDAGIQELFDAFKTILSGLGYYEDALEHIILEEAERYEIRAKRLTDVEEQLRDKVMELQSKLERYKQEEYTRISDNLAKEA
jgi:dsDNA-specific endonuclease/ATPase MutS2